MLVYRFVPMHQQHYTADERAQLEERRRALGDDGMARAERDWAELIASVEAERSRGTDPADPRVQELATRWRALVEQFTGGDPGITAALKRLYAAEGVEKASRGVMSPELMEYVGAAMNAGKPSG
jgi:hypothetical protein